MLVGPEEINFQPLGSDTFYGYSLGSASELTTDQMANILVSGSKRGVIPIASALNRREIKLSSFEKSLGLWDGVVRSEEDALQLATAEASAMGIKVSDGGAWHSNGWTTIVQEETCIFARPGQVVVKKLVPHEVFAISTRGEVTSVRKTSEGLEVINERARISDRVLRLESESKNINLGLPESIMVDETGLWLLVARSRIEGNLDLRMAEKIDHWQYSLPYRDDYVLFKADLNSYVIRPMAIIPHALAHDCLPARSPFRLAVIHSSVIGVATGEGIFFLKHD